MTNQYSCCSLMHNPGVLFLLTIGGFYLAHLWRKDRRSPHPGALPGATAASSRAVWIAVLGTLLLLAGETMGEKALGIFDQQSKITWLFAAYSLLGAPIIEELTFRGFLVIQGRGKTVLWAGAVGASLIFALLHPFLWKWDTNFELTLTKKGGFSAAAVFAMSLWWYVARFAPWNPQQSLLPCFAAHAAKNAAVILIKVAAGYVEGFW
jgi:membrane protease YdiL (CAAX protease family)